MRVWAPLFVLSRTGSLHPLVLSAYLFEFFCVGREGGGGGTALVCARDMGHHHSEGHIFPTYHVSFSILYSFSSERSHEGDDTHADGVLESIGFRPKARVSLLIPRCGCSRSSEKLSIFVFTYSCFDVF